MIYYARMNHLFGIANVVGNEWICLMKKLLKWESKVGLSCVIAYKCKIYVNVCENKICHKN